MTNKPTLVLLSLLVAAPAFACGGSAFSDSQLRVLMLGALCVPLLAALLVDRGAFALAAATLGLKRLHRASIVGPLLGVSAPLLGFFGAATSNVYLAVAGFALVPAAVVVCAWSFGASVLIELRGNKKAQLLRVLAVVAFAAAAVVHVVHVVH